MKTRKEFLLSDSIIEYLQKYQDENNLSSLAAALTGVVEDHKHRNDISATKVLVDALAKQVAEELKDTLTRIRLGTNNADRNSDIILMLLNSQISYSGYKTLIEKETPQLERARQIEKDKIANFRQRKMNKPPHTHQRTSKQPSDSDGFTEDDLLLEGE